MKKRKELCSLTLASTAIILLLIGIAGAAPFAYITNNGGNSVSVIDTATDTFLKELAVGSGPVGVAVNPNGTRVYVANEGSDNVSIIDAISNTVIDDVSGIDNPFGIAINPDGTKVYVTNDGSNTVSVINTTTKNIETITVGNNPYGVAVSPDGTKAYVTNYVDGTVSAINTTTNDVDPPVTVGVMPQGIAVSLDGTKVYVANYGSDTVSVINTTTYDVEDVIVGSKPIGVAVSPDGIKVYVANSFSNYVSAIETNDNSVSAMVSGLNSPMGISASPDGKKVYVANIEGTVSVIDTDTKNLVTLDSGFNFSTPMAFGQFIGGQANITKATPTITWSNPADITFGTALDNTQLNAEASVNGTSVPGNFTYDPAAGTTLGVGNDQELDAEFTPDDSTNYTTESANVSINVTKATPAITWDTPDDIAYGTALDVIQLNATSPVSGNFTYDPDVGTVLGAGNDQELDAEFTPDDSTNYTTESANVSINVTKATPAITWDTPDDIAYGTALDVTQLNATSPVPGNFTYDPDVGTVLGAGNDQELTAEFTPDDATNYTTVSANVTINVTSDTPVITWSNPDDIVYGTTLNDTQLNANASVEGLFGYTPNNGTVLGVGQHTLHADFTPNDAANYTNVSENVTINVTSDTPVITWSNPQDIVYGTTLNDTQLNANASVEGLFVYTPDNGTVLGVGQHTLQADFTPTDAANYTNVSENVTINVTSDTPVITWSNPQDIVYGTTLNDTQLNATASVNGNFTYDPTTGTVLDVGQHTLRVDLTPADAANYTNASKNVTITVLEQPGLVANLYLSINSLESKHPGSSMNYTLYYQNFGNKTAQNAALEDVLSSDVVFESASNGGIYNDSTRTVRWDIGSVAPAGYGYRTIAVEIPLNASNGTIIYNNASINTSDNESRYDDNEISIQTLVASQNLPENVSVEPTIGDAGIPSVYWGEPITFSYHTCDSATGVNISIHIDDGQPDIVENMTGGPSDWNYTTTFNPRTGKATVNYTVYGCNQSPVSFNLYIDPAGYIYDIETGNRIANASVWLQRPDGNENWENVPTGQNPAISQPDTNPLITNNDGMYQWDVLNGTYRVHVEATGYEPQNSYAVTVPPAVTDLHVGLIRIPEANYSIFKSVIDPDPTGDCIINKDGDKVPYRIVVKNEGEVNLTNVAVDDTLISPLPEPTGDDNNDSILNPGEIWIYEAIYTLTSEDVENGSINNNATVTCDQLPGKSSSVNTTVDQNAELSIYKTVTGIDEAGDRIINEIGDIIQYQVAIKNNGNIDLTDVLVSDLMVNLTKKAGDRADSGVLNPGEIWVYAGNYSVTQEDIDRAKSGNALIENTASVSCNQLPNESSSLELPIIYIPPYPPIPPTPESENSKGLPVVNFSTNVTSGNAPLSVQFTDLSQNAISRSWDFNNDGSIDSTDTNPVYTYFTQGTYTVNLTVSNVNGSVSKIASIKVLQAASSGSGGNNDVSGGGESEGKAVIVRNDANSSTANTAAAANVSPTENNNGQSSTPANVEPTPVQTSTGTPAKESKKTPGFELLCGITGLLAVYLYRRR